MRDERGELRRLVVPAAIGVVTLLLGSYFAFLTFRDVWVVPGTDKVAETPRVKTTRLVSRAGGFSLRVPKDMSVSRKGRAVLVSNHAKTLVVTVGPGEGGPLREATQRYLSTLEERYQESRLVDSRPQQVDGRHALTSYGQAVNRRDAKLRFVALMVRAAPRNYTITAFTSFDSDPTVVLPRVQAVANGFRVLPPGSRR